MVLCSFLMSFYTSVYVTIDHQVQCDKPLCTRNLGQFNKDNRLDFNISPEVIDVRDTISLFSLSQRPIDKKSRFE